MAQNLDMTCRIGEENGIRERDDRRSGCGIVIKKERDCTWDQDPVTPLLIVYNLMIRYSEKDKENYARKMLLIKSKRIRG